MKELYFLVTKCMSRIEFTDNEPPFLYNWNLCIRPPDRNTSCIKNNYVDDVQKSQRFYQINGLIKHYAKKCDIAFKGDNPIIPFRKNESYYFMEEMNDCRFLIDILENLYIYFIIKGYIKEVEIIIPLIPLRYLERNFYYMILHAYTTSYKMLKMMLDSPRIQSYKDLLDLKNVCRYELFHQVEKENIPHFGKISKILIEKNYVSKEEMDTFT